MANRATIPAGSVPFVDQNGILTSYGRNLLVQLLISSNEAPGTTIDLPKTAPTGVAPGAGNAVIQAVAGTSPGTAKLIMYAGTSAVPTTIIDNVGGGF
jgi:hypothetical protein